MPPTHFRNASGATGNNLQFLEMGEARNFKCGTHIDNKGTNKKMQN